MSVFTDAELDYLAGQQLGRIATVGADGQPHVVPTSFRYNSEQDAIDVGGMRMSQTKKVRDVRHGGRTSSTTMLARPPRRTSRTFLVWLIRMPPTSMASCSEL